MFSRKGKRKEKDSLTTASSTDDCPRQYLEDSFVLEKVIDADFFKLAILPPCLEYNEWLATHTVTFFNHVNLLYGAISEYCTSESCAAMTGPGNVQYLWSDDKGKKYKYTAPQYVDFIMTHIQKTVLEESTFPTKYGQPFPEKSVFETAIRKINKYLFHVLAHMYHAHYKEILTFCIHPHLNTLFTHFMVFNVHFDLIDVKESEVLSDLLEVLTRSLVDANQNEENKSSANNMTNSSEKVNSDGISEVEQNEIVRS